MRREARVVLGQQLKREMLTKPFFDLNSRTSSNFFSIDLLSGDRLKFSTRRYPASYSYI